MGVPPRIRVAPRGIFTALLVSLAAALLVVVAMALLGEYTKTRGRLLLTALSVAGFCLLALAPATLSQRDKYGSIGAAGVAAASLGLLLVVVGTWATPTPDAYWKSTGIVSLVAASLSYLSGLLLLALTSAPALIARWAAIAAGGVVPVLAALAIILEIKTRAFWWVVSILVVAEIAGGFIAWTLHHWGPGAGQRLLRICSLRRKG